jgi:hypothetical protein
MRFDQVAVPLVPRTTSNCIDLALLFLREHMGPITRLWATIALPACALVYVLVDRYECQLPTGVLVLFLASSPLGILLMTGAAPSAFGEPFTWRRTWAHLGWRGAASLGWGLILRCLIALGLVLFIFPGCLLAVRTGFFVEQAALSKLARHLHDRRTDELLKGEMGDLFVRGAGIAMFCTLLWFVLLLTADFVSSNLLGLPILIGRLNVDFSYLRDFGEFIEYLFRFLWRDPVVVTSAIAVALLVYPLGRLAWFFCYLDVRVRRDCWDMELQILQEAERLGAG